MLIIGTLRSDDGDGNENVVKAIGLPVISKTTTLHVHHTFLYISLPFLHDYDVKMPHFMFYTGRKQATTKFSFSFMTWIRQLEIQLLDSTGTFDKVSAIVIETETITHISISKTVNAWLARKNYFMLFSVPFWKVLEQYKNSWCLHSLKRLWNLRHKKKIFSRSQFSRYCSESNKKGNKTENTLA